ncbi:MAG: ThuA domain-containing protein [Defluviitaleaceae bacterium]|nr:ThuA domain-containing protein [Defluviitaleaceae bacterium]
MNILLLCDDQYHPGNIPSDGLMPFSDKGFTIDVIQDASKFDPAVLSNYAVVVMSKSDHTSSQDLSPWKTSAVQDAFVQYVEGGGGLLVNHSGTVAGTHTATLDKLVGCKFAYHPNQCPVTVQPIKPHPITNNVGMFCEVDEHYNLEILANDVDIITAAYAPPQGIEGESGYDPGGVVAAGYVRTQGKGRVCVLTPGHTADVWHNPHFGQMLANALNWCAGN